MVQFLAKFSAQLEFFCENFLYIVYKGISTGFLVSIGLINVWLYNCRYILEGKKLEFYMKKLQKKKGKSAGAA